MLETLVIGAYVKEAIEHINGGTPSSSIQQEMILIGNKRAPNRTTRFMYAKAGSPTRREAQGDGILIVPEQQAKKQPVREGATLEGGSERAPDMGTQER